MTCEKCGRDSEIKPVKVYYARILSEKKTVQNVSSTKKREVTTTTYKNVLNKDVSVCDSCVSRRKLFNLIMLPIKWIFGATILIAILSPKSPLLQNILYGIAFIVLVLTLIVLITGLVKKTYKQITKSDVYPIAMRILKKQFRKREPKSRFSFWSSYPSNLKRVRY